MRPRSVPAPAPLTPGPALFRGHPMHRRTTTEVDGVVLALRPVVPSDLGGIDRFIAGLSPASRWLRFHAPVRRLSGAQLAGIVDVDHAERETVVAVESGGRIVAVGQYVALGPGTAELALAVADDWQRRGVATRLVAWLADAAREEGFSAFTATVLAENRAGSGLFARWPGTVQVQRSGTTLDVLLCLDPLTSPSAGLASANALLSAPLHEPAR